MKAKSQFLMFILSLVVIVNSCTKNPVAPDYQKEVVVFGYLWGNQRLTAERAILVTYTQPVLKYYDLQKAGIHGATVSITDAGSGREYLLNDSSTKPGFYYNDSLLIHPKNTYHLRVEVDGKVVTASTTVPPDLKMATLLDRDGINYVYQKDLSREKPIYLECESLTQIVLVDMYCNESYQNAEYITPFHSNHKYPDNQDEYDQGKNGEPRHIQGMGKLKDFASDEYPDHYVVFWYSSMIVFYGSHTMKVMAIDDNYHKFIYKEHPELESGVQGGLGVFGSVCGETFKLQVLKP